MNSDYTIYIDESCHLLKDDFPVMAIGSDRVCKEHFWYFAKDFMVIIKTVEPNLRIVTAFCVDETQKLTYYDKYKKYVNSLNDNNEKTHPVGA
jgi:hypothetical protein